MCLSRTLYGCVDWNVLDFRLRSFRLRRTLYGCVDWNQYGAPSGHLRDVAPYMGAWIETVHWHRIDKGTTCRTLYGCVDWNNEADARAAIARSRTLYGCVDWNKTSNLGIKWEIRSHPIWMRGLKRLALARTEVTIRRTLYGCVDWNRGTKTIKRWVQL